MVFLEIISDRANFRYSFAYMWLGLTIAISVAFPLFFRRMHGCLSVSSDDRAPVITVLAAAVALGMVLIMPWIEDKTTFIVAVAVLHTAWLVPAGLR